MKCTPRASETMSDAAKRVRRNFLSAILVWPTIISIGKYKRLNNIYPACYLMLVAVIIQYQLHLPLSYLTKKWFWTIPSTVASIQKVLKDIPPSTSVVTQINILPHLSHRDLIFVA